MKTARRSFGEPYTCEKEWPDDCFVQCGDKGIVFSPNGNYRTAFFEAFPRNPNTFLRGEGATIAEAEQQAWEEFQQVSQCSEHEMERRDYDNGAGFCKKCGFFDAYAFEPIPYPCTKCQRLTRFTASKEGLYYCQEHWRLMPITQLTIVHEWWAEEPEHRVKYEEEYKAKHPDWF